MKKSILIFTTLFLIGCSQSQKDSDKINPKIENINVSDCIELVSETTLEQNGKSVISSPFDLLVLNNLFIVASWNNEIKVFDEDGKYVNAVGRKGDGPGEYRMIHALFEVDKNKFGIYESSKYRISIFNIDGTLQKIMNLANKGLGRTNSIVFYENKYFINSPVLLENKMYGVTAFNDSAKVLGKYVNVDSKYSPYT